jgi:HEPN domain-containing protein
LSSKDEIDLMKRRASVFYEVAQHLFNSGEYDIAAFNAEQATQLYCKAALLERTGDFPRSHSIVDLINRLGEVTSSTTSARDFLKKNHESLKLLELAYLSSRYLPVRFGADDTEKLIAMSKAVKRLIDGLG